MHYNLIVLIWSWNWTNVYDKSSVLLSWFMSLAVAVAAVCIPVSSGLRHP